MSLPVFALMLVVFGLTTGEFVTAGILPDVAAGLRVTVPAAGLLGTAYAVGMIVGGPIVTLATVRAPRKPLITALIAVSIAANLASAAAPSHVLLLAARFAAGLVVATFFALAVATAVSLAPPGRQAAAIAKVALGMNLGIILGTPLGTAIGQHLGWRSTFVAVAAVTAAALLLVLRFVPAGPPVRAAGSGPRSASRPGSGPVLAELRVFTDGGVLRALALTAVGNLGVVTVFSYIAPLLTEASGFPTTTVPALLLVYGAGAVAGNLLGGKLADRALMPSLIWLLTALVGTLGLAWLLADVTTAAIALVFALGVLAFAIIPGMQTRVLTTAGAAPTLALAVNASGFQLAAATAGWLGGAVLGAGAEPRTLYAVGAALTVAGLGIAVGAHVSDRKGRGGGRRGRGPGEGAGAAADGAAPAAGGVPGEAWAAGAEAGGSGAVTPEAGGPGMVGLEAGGAKAIALQATGSPSAAPRDGGPRRVVPTPVVPQVVVSTPAVPQVAVPRESASRIAAPQGAAARSAVPTPAESQAAGARPAAPDAATDGGQP